MSGAGEGDWEVTAHGEGVFFCVGCSTASIETLPTPGCGLGLPSVLTIPAGGVRSGSVTGAGGGPDGWSLRLSRQLSLCRRHRFHPWVRKLPWRRKCQPTPVFLPGESHGQRSLVGYRPGGHKESATVPCREEKRRQRRKEPGQGRLADQHSALRSC